MSPKKIELPESPAEVRPARSRRGRPSNTLRPATDEPILHKGYYITETQYKALKLRAATGDEKDMSGIVRAALDEYLKKEIEMIKTNEN